MIQQKSAQIQIGETIAVLFVFFILILIGFIFYANIIKQNIKSEEDESSQLKSISIVQKTVFLPELQCSEDNIINNNCIDITKLEFAESIMKENELYYYDLFEFSDISVAQIYPEEKEWNIYSRKKDGFTNKFVTNVPISLYNPTTRKNGFGVMSIETFT